jgi:hypothetical protein
VSDQITRLAFESHAHRDRPLLEHDSIGPWGGRVSVTPVTNIGPQVMFEVNVQWLGPPLAIAAVPEDAAHGLLDRTTAVQASDVYYTPERGLALELADRATRQLREPSRPDLRSLAALLKLTR